MDAAVPPSARAEGGEVPATHGPGTAAAETGNRVEHEDAEEEEEEETPQMNVVCTIVSTSSPSNVVWIRTNR